MSNGIGVKKFVVALTGTLLLFGVATGYSEPEITMPPGAKLIFEEDWSTGRIDPQKWYKLHRRWGDGNHGVVPENVFISRDKVFGEDKNVLVCRGHGDLYEGPVVGWKGQKSRVGGVLVSKAFFASGRYEVVMKIGDAKTSPGGPKDSMRPIGMVPAIWTYAYRWVGPGKSDPKFFHHDNPIFNPHMRNEYWSELDFPEFGKEQNFKTGLYNTFTNANHESLNFSTEASIDGDYHVFTSIWRTHFVPMKGVTDSQVAEAEGLWWIQDKSIPFPSYRGNPLKRVGKDQYLLHTGKEVTHFIDGNYVGKNLTYVPALAAQLNIGVWFPR